MSSPTHKTRISDSARPVLRGRHAAITWGLMVAQGRNYLSQAWWLAFFPGLAIMITTLSANLLSNWLRLITDPVQRWRIEAPQTDA